MSTRSHIVIECPIHGKVELYQHHDGYPEGVGYELLDVMDRLKTEESKVGNLLDDFVKKLLAKDDSYEFDATMHGDEDYRYLVEVGYKKITCTKLSKEEEPFDMYEYRANN